MINLKPANAPALNKPNAFVFELVILAVIGVLFYIFLVSPKRTEHTEALNRLEGLNDSYKKIQKESATLDALVQTMKTDTKAIQELDEALPLNGRVTRLRMNLESIAKSSGMYVGDISVTSPVSDEVIAGDKLKLANPYAVARKVQKYDCSLSVSGTMDQFQALLQKLENSGRIMDVKNISINTSKDASLEFRLNLFAYSYE